MLRHRILLSLEHYVANNLHQTELSVVCWVEFSHNWVIDHSASDGLVNPLKAENIMFFTPLQTEQGLYRILDLHDTTIKAPHSPGDSQLHPTTASPKRCIEICVLSTVVLICILYKHRIHCCHCFVLSTTSGTPEQQSVICHRLGLILWPVPVWRVFISQVLSQPDPASPAVACLCY